MSALRTIDSVIKEITEKERKRKHISENKNNVFALKLNKSPIFPQSFTVLSCPQT